MKVDECKRALRRVRKLKPPCYAEFYFESQKKWELWVDYEDKKVFIGRRKGKFLREIYRLTKEYNPLLKHVEPYNVAVIEHNEIAMQALPFYCVLVLKGGEVR